MLEKFVVGALTALICCAIPTLWKLGKQKKAEAIQNGDIYYGILYCRILLLFVLAFLSAEMLLMILLGDSLNGTSALILTIICTFPFTALYVYLYRKNFTQKHLNTLSNPLGEIMKEYAVERREAILANHAAQELHLNDPEYGLSILKPIYTHAVAGEEKYLSSLRTTNGEPITWYRKGSVSIDGIHGPIDVYETYLPSGELYKTLYINIYCLKEPTRAPLGFYLETEQDVGCFDRASSTDEPLKPTYKPEVLSASTNEKYYFDSESKSFKLKDEYRNEKTLSKSKLSIIVIVLVIVIALVFVASRILAPSTPMQIYTVAAPSPTPYQSTGDYWQDQMNQLLDEVEKKESINQDSSVFAHGKIIVDPVSPRVCPLTVVVSGGDSYYVYMKSLTRWNDDISFMIDADSPVSLEVPLGSYEFYCATGKTWQGQVYKFGPNTKYYKAKTTLDFTSDGEFNYGYKIELHGESDGNLDRTAIDESTFPG